MRALLSNLCQVLLILVAVVASSPQLARAQTANTPPPSHARMSQRDALILLTYEVGDLVFSVPDYSYTGSAGAGGRGLGGLGGGMMGGVGGGGMGGFFNVQSDLAFHTGEQASAEPNRHITMMDLTRVIAAVIAPETWSENGDGDGELQVLGTALVVRQSQAVHKQIEDLLEQLRQGSGKRKTVSVDARWLLLNSDDLAKLTSSDAEGNTQVDPTVLAEYTRRPSSIRGLTHCFSGQLVYLVSGTRQSVVTGVIPVVGSVGNPEQYGAQFASRGVRDSNIVFTAQVGDTGFGGGGMGGANLVETRQRSVGYQPVVERPNFGALLEIRPTLIPGDNTAIVDLKSSITVPGEPATQSSNQPRPASDVPTVDRLAIDTQNFATTLSVPLDKPVLVGGLTYIASGMLTLTPATRTATPDSPTSATETPQLYLVLQLH